jgi:hypothetical protein
MPTNPGTGGSLARTIDEQFLALMCFNEDLLRAEFDTIITAEWPRPLANRPGRRPAHRRPAKQSPRQPGNASNCWQVIVAGPVRRLGSGANANGTADGTVGHRLIARMRRTARARRLNGSCPPVLPGAR